MKGSTGKENAGEKGSTWEERAEGCGGNKLEEEPGAGMLNRILG